MKQSNIKKSAGFTLMELMITVAIIGILAAITIPSYVEYVKKTKRTDAKVGLLKIAQMQESYYVQNMSYAKTAAQLGFTAATNPIKTENEEYSIALSGFTPSTCTGKAGAGQTPCTAFKLTAQPMTGSAQNNDTYCGFFTLTNTGLKGVGADSNGVTGHAKKCWK